MQWYKLHANTGSTLLLTIVPCVIIELPFTITHKLPAACLFFPFLILICAITAFMQRVVYTNTIRLFQSIMPIMRYILFSNVTADGEIVDLALEIDQSGCLALLPSLFGAN